MVTLDSILDSIRAVDPEWFDYDSTAKDFEGVLKKALLVDTSTASVDWIGYNLAVFLNAHLYNWSPLQRKEDHKRFGRVLGEECVQSIESVRDQYDGKPDYWQALAIWELALTDKWEAYQEAFCRVCESVDCYCDHDGCPCCGM